MPSKRVMLVFTGVAKYLSQSCPKKADGSQPSTNLNVF